MSNIGWLKLWMPYVDIDEDIHSSLKYPKQLEMKKITTIWDFLFKKNMAISFKYFVTQFHQSLSCNFWRVLPFITKYISYWSDLLVTSHAHMVDQYVCSGLKVGLGLHFSRLWRSCWYVVTRSHTDQFDAQNVQIQNYSMYTFII